MGTNNPLDALGQKEKFVNPLDAMGTPKVSGNPLDALGKDPLRPITLEEMLPDIPQLNPGERAILNTAVKAKDAITGAGRTITDQVFDFLSRGQYASAKFSETLSKDGLSALGQALANAGAEFADPKSKLSYYDLMHPEFKKNNPIASHLLGFVADNALDPATYLTFGAANAVRAGGKALSGKGVKKLGQTIEQLTTASRAAGVPESASAIRETAEEFISAMATMGDKGLFDKGGLKFNVPLTTTAEVLSRGGVKAKQVTLIPQAALDVALGPFTKAMKATQAIPGVKALVAFEEGVKSTLSRNKEILELPQGHEYLDLRKTLEGKKSFVERDVTEATRKLFRLSADEREQLGETAVKIRDLTKLTQDNVRLKTGNPDYRLNAAEAQNILNQVLPAAKLTPKQMAVYASMQQAFKQAGEAEVQAGLLEHLIKNYTPKLYQELKDGVKVKKWKRQGPGLSTYLSSSEKTVFDTMEQAKRHGYVPELDAAVLYSTRLINSRTKVAHDEFNKGVQALFGNNIPDAIKHDLQFIGEGIYPANWSNSKRIVVEGFDAMDRAFKKFATVVKPAFGIKQLPQNFMQGFATQGAKVFGVLDPRVIGDAMDTVVNGSARFDLKTSLGQTYTGAELTQLTKDFDIIRGTTGAGDRFTRSLKSQLRTDNAIRAVSMGSENLEGMAKLGAGMLNWLTWPSHIEDTSRASLFYNGLRIGHSPKDAAALVDKALFNYGQGLSSFEAQVMKRVLPFYSFQRFAYPLVAETIATHPGRVAALGKAGKTFGAVWNKVVSGDALTEAEQRVIPGYQLEQSGFMEGFSPEVKATFKNFNSYSPMDVLSGVTTDDQGAMDIPRTLEKGFLGQLAPRLKVPIELAMRKKLFSGQEIKQGGKVGEASKVDPKTLLRNLVATLSASAGGAIPAALGYAVGDVAGRMLPEEVVKRALGWKEGPDLEGKQQVFINPWLAYAVESVVPVWGAVLRQTKSELTPTEKVQSLFFGIGTNKFDLQKSQQIRLGQQKKERANIMHDYGKAIATGNTNMKDRAQQDLNDLLTIIKEDEIIRSRNAPIRGVAAPGVPIQ